jgi:excisionase family DNA binding protein
MSDYVTAAEAAELLGVSDTHVRRHIQSGTVNAKKVKGRWSIALTDLDGLDLSGPPNERHDERTARRTNDRTDERPAGETTGRTNDKTPERTNDKTNDTWRDDLLAQVARLEANEGAMRTDFDTRLAEQRQESGLLVEASKARIIDLERELTVRDSRNADMQSDVSDSRGQVAVLEAKVRSTLEERAEEIGGLAREIAGLVKTQQDMQTRVYELEPVASQVPMLQAAVEEKDASLSERERELGNMRQDIETIASRPVTGPVFRLLTKGKLRR